VSLTIAAVGKAGQGPEAELVASYLRRLPWPARMVEVEARGAKTAAGRQRREGEKLLAALPESAKVVCLDEAGRQMTSEAFAEALGHWREEAGSIAFLIGGADGHGEAVRARADVTLSLSQMTWPHLLTRVLLAEQLYRACSILAGHPYHRG